jgi:hypothetical protein
MIVMFAKATPAEYDGPGGAWVQAPVYGGLLDASPTRPFEGPLLALADSPILALLVDPALPAGST